MCGFAGIAAKENLDDPSSALRKLSSALSHRGPDGEGFFHDQKVALVHRRLSIIDLEGGSQPITSRSGNVLVANGEIYNDPDIRRDLASYPFATRSDSESLLAVYETGGGLQTERLRGMYALAIYSPSRGQVVLARDPYGIKPLYYAEQQDRVVFASEPQALFAAGLVRPQINNSKARELLQLKFTTARETVFDGIFRVLPGEVITIENGRIIERRRENPFVADTAPPPLGIEAARREMDEQLRQSVAAHVRSDVPLGIFLSGGVDSCSIAAAMAANGLKDFPCYTAYFPDSNLPTELRVAEKVAHAVGGEHVKVAIRESDFWTALPQVIARIDDPSLDPAMVANFILAERASQDTKVVLGGDGGDEIFGGYRRYERAVLPKWLRFNNIRTKSAFAGTQLMIDHNGSDWRTDFATSVTAAERNTKTFLQKLQATDGADYLPHFNLMKLDRCLMAHGLEGRTPLLDRHLSQFGFNLPDRYKLKYPYGKWILRDWLNTQIPEAEPFAAKRGFSVPVVSWITQKAGRFTDFVCDQNAVRALFSVDAVRTIFADPNHRHKKHRWPILFYALWNAHHVEGENVHQPFENL